MLTFQIYLDRQHKRFNELVFDTLSESEMGEIFNLVEDYATEKIDEYVDMGAEKYNPHLANLESFKSQIIGLRAFFHKGSPLTNMFGKIIKDHE